MRFTYDKKLPVLLAEIEEFLALQRVPSLCSL